MVKTNFNLLLLITIFHVSHCERRIVDGKPVTSEKSYVVYLVKAIQSGRTYDSWLCGGALVSKNFIITSAACVEDVRYMYAIAGYNKYVNDKYLHTDHCTDQLKKKIVYTCIPVSYEFDFNKVEKWAYIDIALVKVESPYNFDDPRYQLMCSYIPSIIPINYDPKRQGTNVDAMVLGWGHTAYWRQHGDIENYNQDYLHFGATTLLDKNKCQQKYTDYPDLMKIIEKYMICSMEPGHLDDHGVPYSMNQRQVKGKCINEQEKSMGYEGELCKVEITSEQPEQALMDHLMHDADETRKRMNSNSNHLTKINVNGTGFVKGTDNGNGTDVVNGTDIVNETYNDNGTDIVNETDIINGTNIGDRTGINNATDSFNGTDFIYKPGFGNISGYFNRTFTRRNGICQNDHGGPIITWVGKREVLIGVASVFRITKENKCIGPFLYTSTVCNGAFLGCMLGDRKANVLRGKNMSISTSQALFCDSPPSVKGFDTIESYVSWKDHPDGPADNEKQMRGKLVPNVKRDRYATNVNEDLEDVNSSNDINTQHKIFPNLRLKKGEQETNDRFSLRIGMPPGIKPSPRKRRPLRKRPSPRTRPPSEQEVPSFVRSSQEIETTPVIGSPQEMQSPPIHSPSPELAPPPITSTAQSSIEMEPLKIIRAPPIIRPPPIVRRPPEIRHLPILRPQPIMRHSPKIRLPPQMEPPGFDEILNFESDEVFVTKSFKSKPILKADLRSVVQPERESQIQIRPQRPFRV